MRAGNLTYTSAADAFGSATVTVLVTDNGGTANGGRGQLGRAELHHHRQRRSTMPRVLGANALSIEQGRRRWCSARPT